ncbi:hypothetical protein [Nonomuraea sp. PA05]|uniref:hypothetical protein n=1 Tax=Nonomuraea sp. PA05 TaxID=2604466 RepID=UPI001652A4C2
MANPDHPDHAVQTRAPHAYLHWRSAPARHPDALTAQRRKGARMRSEKGHPLRRPTTYPGSLNPHPTR